MDDLLNAGIVIAGMGVMIWLWLAVPPYLDMLHEWRIGRSYARPLFFRWMLWLPNPWNPTADEYYSRRDRQ